MTTAIRSLAARMVVPGVPPNWSQWRGSSLARGVAMKPWRELAWYAAQSARNEVGWRLPVKCDPPAPRWLTVEVRKLRPWYDPDGAVNCLKPLIDGMKGVLAWDDSYDWLRLLTPPAEMQRLAANQGAQQVVLTVHLIDPRGGS